jgi:hypothetical protein
MHAMVVPSWCHLSLYEVASLRILALMHTSPRLMWLLLMQSSDAYLACSCCSLHS